MKTHLDYKILDSWKEIDPLGWEVLVDEIIEIFLTTTPLMMENLSRARKGKDWTTLQREAHTLKSSCGNVGARHGHKIFSEIEELCKKKEEKLIDIKINEVSKDIEQIFTELKNYRKTKSKVA